MTIVVFHNLSACPCTVKQSRHERLCHWPKQGYWSEVADHLCNRLDQVTGQLSHNYWAEILAACGPPVPIMPSIPLEQALESSGEQ